MSMTGREQDEAPLRPPSLGGAIRDAASDYFYNSWRLVPINVVWGVALITAASAWLSLGILVAVLLGVLLAIPVAGLFRIADNIVRGRGANLSDALDPLREPHGVRRILTAGALYVVAVFLFSTNLQAGAFIDGPVGWAFATLAAWGLLVTFLLGWAFWPLAVDPRRGDASWIERFRLAVFLLVAHPVRLIALGVLLAVLLAVSTVVVIALVTVSLGFAALVSARYLLPASDRLESLLVGRGTIRPMLLPDDDATE